MKDVRWGIIGAGDVAERKGGPALYTAAHSKLVAVMSRRRERAEGFAERHGAARWYTSVDELLADDEVDAVYVATPPSVHAELTERAAGAGKHVLCEKPMAMTVAECRRMIDACGEAGVQLMIAYYRRFWPVAVRIKEVLEAGTIGRVLRARAEVADPYDADVIAGRSWLVDPEVAGGGFLTDVATHRLDLFAFLLGRVRDVAAFVETQHVDIEVDDASSLLLRFEGGVHAGGAFNWNVGVGIDEFEVCGTRGRLISRDLGAGDLEITADGETERVTLPPPSITHLHLVEHFVTCLRDGTPNALSGEEGMQATVVTEAAYRSAREGRVVRVAGDAAHAG